MESSTQGNEMGIQDDSGTGVLEHVTVAASTSSAAESASGATVLELPPSSGDVGSFVPTGVRRGRPPKMYRIGEVVEYSGMSRQTIHNYTTMGLIHESKWTNGGHRLYDDSVFERLDVIAAMKAQNRSLEDIRNHFGE